jgi:hypothetical protein
MNCTEVVKARVSPEMKCLVKTLAERELVTESAWLKRLVTRELRAANEAGTPTSMEDVSVRPGHVRVSNVSMCVSVLRIGSCSKHEPRPVECGQQPIWQF